MSARCLLLSLMLCVSTALFSTGWAQEPSAKVPAARSQIVDGSRKLEILDLTPRFLDFYSAAQNIDADARWKLWQEKYGFAAVPPTPQGMELARKMLDSAWPKYAAELSSIRQGAAAVQPQPAEVLKKVADVLTVDQPLEIEVLIYVGAFDENAFTSRGPSGKPRVAIPQEMSPKLRSIVFPHEMTHAVHLSTAGLSGGWERSIAETVVQEGLALHVVKVVTPGLTDREYVEHAPGWYDSVMANAPAILKGIAADLDKKDSDTVFKYTMGKGTTGLQREAYAAGWLVVGEMLKQGRTLPQIARIPESEMAATVRATIDKMAASKGAEGR